MQLLLQALPMQIFGLFPKLINQELAIYIDKTAKNHRLQTPDLATDPSVLRYDLISSCLFLQPDIYWMAEHNSTLRETIMTTATLGTSSSSTVGLGTRVDEWLGALLSVKPSVIAACFSTAMKASQSIGADELSSVSPEQLSTVRKTMGLQA